MSDRTRIYDHSLKINDKIHYIRSNILRPEENSTDEIIVFL